MEQRNYASFSADIARVLQGEEVRSEYTLRRRIGPPMEVSTTFIPHFDQQQNLLGYFFLGQDLTEHKHTQRELMESHKMQALGLLTGGVAHDFNNLLTIILGNLNFLEDEQLDRDEIQEAVQGCKQAAKRGSNLIQRLLTFSRRQSLKPEVTSINALIESFAQLMQRTLGEKVHIDCQLQRQLQRVCIDNNQLETCLLNLALNARDAMPRGGLLQITTRMYQHQASSTRFTALEPGLYTMITVSDEGEGMSAETISRVFEPFFTTKPAGMGTGLGLSMVYGFVKQSGGSIEIESIPDKGSSIHLVFPSVNEREIAVGEVGSRNHEAEQSAQILLVEDDEGVRRFVQRSLRKMGYLVDLAENGELALQQLRSRPAYDLVLTDIVMPGKISGLDLHELVKQEYPQTQVLCMTGYSEQLEEQLPDALLLRKPFQTHELANKLQELFTHHG